MDLSCKVSYVTSEAQMKIKKTEQRTISSKIVHLEKVPTPLNLPKFCKVWGQGCLCISEVQFYIAERRDITMMRQLRLPSRSTWFELAIRHRQQNKH